MKKQRVLDMNVAQLKINKFDIGDLVWIPANTNLYSHPNAWMGVSTLKEPMYGIVIEIDPTVSRVLITDKIYYISNTNLYGEKNDY